MGQAKSRAFPRVEREEVGTVKKKRPIVISMNAKPTATAAPVLQCLCVALRSLSFNRAVWQNAVEYL